MRNDDFEFWCDEKNCTEYFEEEEDDFFTEERVLVEEASASQFDYVEFYKNGFVFKKVLKRDQKVWMKYRYNSAGQVTFILDSFRGWEKYTYNGNGELVSFRNSNDEFKKFK
jgi:hypothetical protein